MPLTGLRVLVVEDEYLIAIDAAYILRGAGVLYVETCTRAEFAETLLAQEFDAVLVAAGPNASHIEADIDLAKLAGARIAFTTSDTGLVAGLAGLEGVHFIAKPFDERQLNALVALLRDHPLDTDGLRDTAIATGHRFADASARRWHLFARDLAPTISGR